jgi:hypothetical protein
MHRDENLHEPNHLDVQDVVPVAVLQHLDAGSCSPFAHLFAVELGPCVQVNYHRYLFLPEQRHFHFTFSSRFKRMVSQDRDWLKVVGLERYTPFSVS